MATVSDVSTVRLSGDPRADTLLQQMPDWNFLLPARTTLFYTFDLEFMAPAAASPVTAFNPDQRAAVVQILNHVSSVSGIDFAETASAAAADLHFGASDIAGDSLAGLTRTRENWFSMPDGSVTEYSADVFIYLDDVEFLSTNGHPVAGSSGYQILLHEIGHALGLGHPFEGPHALPAEQDNTDNTVMSYVAVGSHKETFQAYDLLALRWIYGEDGLRGDHGLNSTFGPSLSTGGVAMNIVTGTASADSLMGSAGRDAMQGLDGNDTLDGGAGDDRLDGGAGIDLAIFGATRGGATIDATADGFTVTSDIESLMQGPSMHIRNWARGPAIRRSSSCCTRTSWGMPHPMKTGTTSSACWTAGPPRWRSWA